MAAEGAESLGMPWSLGVANHATKVLRCLKATATRVLRRFSSSSAHPRPGLGLEVGIIGAWSMGGYGVRAGSKRRIAVQGGSVFVAKLGHASRWRWKTWG